MRIFFIPGLGEEKWIFNKIEAFIAGEKVFIDNWTLLTEIYEADINALTYANFLVERFRITDRDVVIGHSLGGWVAAQIKNVVNCPIVQIAAFTDARKAFKPVNRHVMFWLAKHGVGLNTLVLEVLIFFKYRNEASKEVLKTIFKKIMAADKSTLVKQLKVVYNPVQIPLTVKPDLRIHSKRDEVVQPPDEEFVDVPGDHFALYTFPDTVYKPINTFLKNIF